MESPIFPSSSLEAELNARAASLFLRTPPLPTGQIVPFQREFPFELLSMFIGHLDQDSLKACSLVDRHFNDEANRWLWESITIRQVFDGRQTIEEAAALILRSPRRARWIRNMTVHLRDLPFPYHERECADMLDMLCRALQTTSCLRSLKLFVNVDHVPLVARHLASRPFSFRLRELQTNVPFLALPHFLTPAALAEIEADKTKGDVYSFLESQTLIDTYDEILAPAPVRYDQEANALPIATESLISRPNDILPRLKHLNCHASLLPALLSSPAEGKKARTLQSIGTSVSTETDIAALVRGMRASSVPVNNLRLTLDMQSSYAQRRRNSNSASSATSLAASRATAAALLTNGSTSMKHAEKGALIPLLFTALQGSSEKSAKEDEVSSPIEVKNLTLRVQTTTGFKSEFVEPVRDGLRSLRALESVWLWGRWTNAFVRELSPRGSGSALALNTTEGAVAAEFAGKALENVRIGGFESPVKAWTRSTEGKKVKWVKVDFTGDENLSPLSPA